MNIHTFKGAVIIATKIICIMTALLLLFPLSPINAWLFSFLIVAILEYLL